jgi:hypothetical protein
LKIAGRIGALLEKEIGVGVDATRMLTERRYMRDVLLVCDAHPGSELGQLALWFRQCATEEPADATAPRSGFGLDSAFGTSSSDSWRSPERAHPAPAAFVMPKRAAQPASWLSRSRWGAVAA